ncbi:MAG: hypothetical protein HC829_02285 [Bacteroidales bacterium]|nr:hypothetical protein [Bacteroidales bacterium]
MSLSVLMIVGIIAPAHDRFLAGKAIRRGIEQILITLPQRGRLGLMKCLGCEPAVEPLDTRVPGVDAVDAKGAHRDLPRW